MEDERQNLVVELIEAAVFSGAYSGLAKAHPDSRGMETLRLKWRARVSALASEICADLGLTGQGSATMPRSAR